MMNRYALEEGKAKKSIYEMALGEDFAKLHPRIQERFSLHSGCGTAAVGKGRMTSIWHHPLAGIPLRLGAARNIMVPESGFDIGFTVENHAYKDHFGRETVTWIRTFHFPRRIRRFDATMIYSRSRRCIVDYLGNKQHLAVDLELGVSPQGGIMIASGEQRFYEGWAGFRFPEPFTGRAEVEEWFDEDSGQFRIAVVVRNPWLGDIFRYEGSFDSELEAAAAPVPARLLPLRTERRE